MLVGLIKYGFELCIRVSQSRSTGEEKLLCWTAEDAVILGDEPFSGKQILLRPSRVAFTYTGYNKTRLMNNDDSCPLTLATICCTRSDACLGQRRTTM